MIRTVLAVTAIAFGVCAAIAQDDPIKARQDLMKANGAAAKTAGAMMKGDKPFDLAEAHKIFATFENAGEKMPALFPDNSKTGEKTAALPKIWEDMADFKAKFAKLASDAKAASASVTDLDTFKASMANIGKNDCGACHQLYRAKQS